MRTLDRRRAALDARGFSLIELVVVIFLLGILGAITTAGIASALQTTRQDSARINSTAMMETQLQRMARDLRVADPLRSATTSDLVFDVFRASTCRRVEYRISSGVLQARTQTWSATSACAVYPATTTATSDSGYVNLLSSVTSATPFVLEDGAGNTLTSPTVTSVKRIRISLTQSQPEGRAAVAMTAETELRNAP